MGEGEGSTSNRQRELGSKHKHWPFKKKKKKSFPIPGRGLELGDGRLIKLLLQSASDVPGTVLGTAGVVQEQHIVPLFMAWWGVQEINVLGQESVKVTGVFT